MTSLRTFLNPENRWSTLMIPKWFYSLTHLEVIDLSSNKLQHVIASDIENLTSLTSLNLGYNQLEGDIPISLGKLRNLKEITLSYNNFYKLDIGDFLKSFMLRSLELIKLDGANVTGQLPDVLGEFKNLSYLDLSLNSFSGQVPLSIGRLSNLKYLDLSDNLLNGTLPDSLGKLSNLKNLGLSNNRFNGTLPATIGQLKTLESIDLSGNILEGVVTDLHFADLERLKYLYASGNKLTWKSSDVLIPSFQLTDLMLSNWQLGPRFPSWLQYQQQLTYLELSNTGLSDFIPTKFWDRMRFFRYLNLSSNEIYGEIPSDEIVYSGYYSIIDMSSNNFTGSLTPYFSNVGWLDLSRNRFSGSLSSFLCNRTESDVGNRYERFLNLENNLLTGEIPDCWEQWESLASLKLGNNYLTGSIPNSFGHLRELESLHLRNNHLSGKLPQTLQNCHILAVLDLGWNQLEGTIPTWVAKSFQWLVNLNLHSNRFYGEIPNELCHIQSLQILYLGDNSFADLVPKCFNNFTAMIDTKPNIFYLTYTVENDFSVQNRYSEISENGVLVTKGRESEYSSTIRLVKLMDLSSNNFQGLIPEELTRLVDLRFLNLSWNRFSGSIPNNIGNMGSLESLDPSCNQLSSEIPLSISHLTFLSYLNVSNNELSRRIPSSTQLQSLDKSNFLGNNLCGAPLAECNTNAIEPKVVLEDGETGDGEGFRDLWFIGSVAVGFIVGFGTVLIPIVISSSWRVTYFTALDSFWCKIYVFVYRCWYVVSNK